MDIEDGPLDVNYEKNPELKKLKFLSPGPKMAETKNIKAENDLPPLPKSKGRYDQKSSIKEVKEITRRRPARTTRVKKSSLALMVDDYTCRVCDRGDSEESMLLCDGCDSSYHTFCLIPPLTSVPPGDWRCPKCVAQECSKPQEAYGFEQAKTQYTLREFGFMADKFKEEYFGVSAHEVPTEVAEDEFWRLVSSLDDEVVVEYGADLHTIEHGSGFPTKRNTDDPDDEKYVKSWWNLNNLPVHEKSVLGHINADISGMKIPWIYVGMCFSSFCWHIEDHWSYSINYMHWGEPKTWYGVPGAAAEKFEGVMKEAAPELFESQPDLLHHLVTIINPNTLMANDVPIVRTNQYAGEFVVTFPRAYHAGFNQGYNFAEAVNFCPSDWLPMGRKCIDHYRSVFRSPVFSHEELVCKMAANPDELDLDLATAVYEDMEAMVKEEIYLRIDLKAKGVSESEREAFELLPDDERQCCICKTALFFSAIHCSCRKDQMSCLYHADELCPCGKMKKSIRYRYTLEELPAMLSQLKKRADSFDNWCKDVQLVLQCKDADKRELMEFKELLFEAEQNQFRPCALLDQLKSAVSESEQCAQVATQLFVKKHKTRHSSGGSTPGPKLTIEELKDFVQQVNNLPCVIKEASLVAALLTQVENFQYEASCILKEATCDLTKLTDLLEHGMSLDIELPELNDIKQELKAVKWLRKVTAALDCDEQLSLDVLRTLIDQGMKLHKKPVLEKPLRELKELLFKSDRWEEKAKLCLHAKPRHASSTIDAIINEACKVKVVLPNVLLLRESLRKAGNWSEQVDRIQNDKNYPYLDVLECLVNRGRPIPVRLDQLPQMESQIAAAKAWKDRTARTFIKKGSSRPLLELLKPRTDIGKQSAYAKAKKKREKDEKEKKEKKEKEREQSIALEDMNIDEYIAPDRLSTLQELKDLERNETELLKRLRTENLIKLDEKRIDGPFCLCRKGIEGFMLRCCVCYDWYHNSCVALPKVVDGKPISRSLAPWEVMKDVKFACPLCQRSRRPRLDTILSLLVSLQKLPVRLPEGEALQFLAERAMRWQDNAKKLLQSNHIQKLLADLSMCLENDAQKSVGGPNTNLIISKTFYEDASANAKGDQDGALLDRNMNSNEIVNGAHPNANTMKTEIDHLSYCKIPEEKMLLTDEAATVSETKTTKLDATGPKQKNAEDNFSLECEEQMTESPKSSSPREDFKDGINEEDSEELSSLVATKPPRPQSPRDVCTLGEDDRRKKDSPPSSNINQLIDDSVLCSVEDLLMQGDMLEVTMDETRPLWTILQHQKPLQEKDCQILEPEFRKLLLKDRKKKKRKFEEDGKQPDNGRSSLPTIPVSNGKAGNSADANGSSQKKTKKDDCETAEGTEADDDQDDDQDDYDEDCAATACKQPTGDEVGWVQCDPCSSWYHVMCVGITAEVADAMDTYVCASCEPRVIAAKTCSN